MAAFYTSATERASAATAKRQALKLAKALGVTIEQRFNGGWHEILLQAPAHKRFYQSEVHEIVLANAGAMTDGLWEAAEKDLRYERIEDCPDPQCEWCNDDDSDAG
jgi:hypothetical protein